MNKAEARTLVAVAISSCPSQGGRMERQQIDDMGAAWAMLLEDVAYSDASAALKRYLATSKWLPSPSEIRAIVAEAKHGGRRPGGEAWGDVLRAVGRFGAYREPTFSDPLVTRSVAALGWRELCLSENQVADRARFVDLYDRLATEAATERTVATLPGVARPALPAAVGALVVDLTKRLRGEP